MKTSAEEIRLVRTCFAYPEQYDAYDQDDVQVGYMRLRHGFFRVDFPYCGGETLYKAETVGYGIFEDDERDYHLARAKEAIAARLSVREMEQQQ